MRRHRSGIKFASCPRCGIHRTVHVSRVPGLCKDCWQLQFEKPVLDDERPIGWERVGNVMRQIRCHCGEPLTSRQDVCIGCLRWAERDSVRASWRRLEEAA